MGGVTRLPEIGRRRLTPPAPIADGHGLSAFCCGHDMLDDWLKKRARSSEGRTARTFVVCADGNVVGYYCLAAGAERREAMPKGLRRNVPDPVPVTILGRLAVDKAHQGRKIGAHLLKDAMLRALGASETIGSRALLVHAIDPAAVAFYVKFGFLEFPDGSKTMFLPMETIAGA